VTRAAMSLAESLEIGPFGQSDSCIRSWQGTALAGPDARVSCRRCSSEHNGSTWAVRLLVVDEQAAA
jgi:hypothetical protein